MAHIKALKWPDLENDEQSELNKIVASLTAGLNIMEALTVKKASLGQT